MLFARVLRLLPPLGLWLALTGSAAAAELAVKVTYLGRQEPPPIPLSLVEPVLTDEGQQGAEQG